jgi:hypothetical protein
MRSHSFVAACALLARTHAFAATEYVADVQQAYEPSAHVKRVAVAPIGCPADLNCNDLQEMVEKLVSKRTQLQIITAEDTQKMMTRAGIAKLDFETRYILLEGLKADALVALDVQRAGVELVEGDVVKIGQAEVSDGPVKIKHVKLALEMATKDGSTLLQASGEGKVQGFKSLDGVAQQTLETMIDRSMPKTD